MQNEITSQAQLLTANGNLAQRGWGRSSHLDYQRDLIAASSFRIKEWDYYCVLSDVEGFSLTFSDLGYIGFIAATVFDFVSGTETSNAITTLLPLGRLALPPSSESGDIHWENKQCRIAIQHQKESRQIEVFWKHFKKDQDLHANLHLEKMPDDRMMIATPFQDSAKAFYYNQKLNCMPVQGTVTLGQRQMNFNPRDAFGVLDWGRGVWTYANTWYWASASGMIKGKRFGLNLGYGFGDTSAASENIIFMDGVGHKLDQVTFHIPEPDFLRPWQFSSNDGRLELDFIPILDRYSNTNMGLIQSWQHQVFGRYTGRVKLDDGQVLEINNLLGFAEKVKNRW